MTFVHPLLLAGTALVALPIVLHLIMRQRPKRLEFPALRFIQKRHDANRRRLRLQHLLLLLLRAAVIALLACALAQPSVKFFGALVSQEAPVAAALVFDTAPRMEYRHENRSRLEAAGELGRWLLGQLPRNSQIAVLDTGPATAVLHDDRGMARARIDRLATVNDSYPLTGAVQEAMRQIGQSKLPRKEVYVFTDLSRAAWPGDSAAALQDRLAETPGVAVYLIDVGVRQPSDYALGELRLSGQVISHRSSLQIETELLRIGPAGKPTVELYLLDADQKAQKANEQSYELEANGSQRVDFRVESLGVGTHQGSLRIVGQDALSCNDTRYFTVEVKPAWRILVAAPRPAPYYALFLTEALAPTVFRKQGQASFDCDVVDMEELSGRSLDDYAAVCLVDPKPPQPPVWQKLGDYVSEGHGLAVFLGRNATPVDSFNAAGAQELLPGKLLRQARAPQGDLYLAPRALQHPALSEFRGYSGSIPWQAFPVLRYWQLEAPVGAILPFGNGRPALLERSLGSGHVLMMTTPVSDRPNRKPWNLLPVGEAWPFGMLIKGMMLYLVGSSDQQLNYFAGQTVALPLEARSRRRAYLLSTPDGLRFPLSADLKQRLLVATSTDQVGNYRIGGGGEANRGFSVNLAPRQTQLDRITEQELAEVFGPLDYRVARTRREIHRDLSEGRVGRELFGPLILLVAVALAMEYLVANRFYKPC
ncbi:MAG: hypothetical protein A2V70_14295 [Planctomycetes bacterium RBG_13_63_9]|nr:MAG: hypothetical protein A2V70_14295 [Planctomycetes bacterium RBG_13_63_9]